MALEARPLPVPTIGDLCPPRQGFPYFANADKVRLDTAASDFSAANAWWLADASFLVYGDATFIQNAVADSPLPGLGFKLDWLGTAEDNAGILPLCSSG